MQTFHAHPEPPNPGPVSTHPLGQGTHGHLAPSGRLVVMGGPNEDQVSAAISVHIHRAEGGPKVGANLSTETQVILPAPVRSATPLSPLPGLQNLPHGPKAPSSFPSLPLDTQRTLTVHSGSLCTNLGPCDLSLWPPLPGCLDEDDNLPDVLMARGPQDQALHPLPKGQFSGVTLGLGCAPQHRGFLPTPAGCLSPVPHPPPPLTQVRVLRVCVLLRHVDERGTPIWGIQEGTSRPVKASHSPQNWSILRGNDFKAEQVGLSTHRNTHS